MHTCTLQIGPFQLTARPMALVTLTFMRQIALWSFCGSGRGHAVLLLSFKLFDEIPFVCISQEMKRNFKVIQRKHYYHFSPADALVFSCDEQGKEMYNVISLKNTLPYKIAFKVRF